MSTFLGPIHYWLFNKIRLVEAREKLLVEKLGERFGGDASALAAEGRAKFGEYYDDTALEEMIGQEPIHTYLAASIEKVETREAALLKAAIEKFGDDARALAMDVARDHGKEVGEAEAAEVSPETADDVYRAVKNTFLDGMPCDHVVDVQNNSEKDLTEIHTDCLHRPYWQSAGAEEVFMCEYLGRWLDGFVEGVGANGSHSRGNTIVKGAQSCEDFYKLA